LLAFEVENKRLIELSLIEQSKEEIELPTQTLLTAREKQVLELLAGGDSYAAIAQKLVITENTLKTHIKNIYSKLEVRNRTQAVNTAVELGYLN
jgi:ATP/maltotriose-dependent transcriptional regulator MalT